VKLFSVQGSPNCRRVNATIQHLGLSSSDIEVVESAMGNLKTPDYLALNPNGKVPLLVDGDLHLWESRSIMQYLVASKKPNNALWPDDLKKRADIARWQFWDATHLSRGTGVYAFENFVKKIFMKQEPDPVALKIGEKEWNTFAPVLNAQLEKTKKWVTGDDLTLADFSVGACFSFAAQSALPVDSFTHITAWLARLDDVPAWKNTAPKLG